MWPLALGLVFLLLAGGAAAVLLILHPFGHASPRAGPRPSSGAAKQSGASSQPAQSTEQQAAQRLSALLAQSVTDRNDVVNAVSDVKRCGPGLSGDAQIFAQAAASRQRLLGSLTSLPGRSTLPATMLAALTSAWQESAKADRDYQGWAQDESQSCSPVNNESDPHYQAAIVPDSQATVSKQTFASLWRPIASRYGLTSYSAGNL